MKDVSAPQTICTTCPYCGVGCGVRATPDGMGGAEIAGDPAHPANLGRLCSKGSALGETLDMDDRLLAPRVDGNDTNWDDALDLVATKFRDTIRDHGPDSVAFYVSGQLLTEDYYVANKLMKGFMGSANIDTNSRLCMASSVAGHKRAFGTDTVPGQYTDLEEADLVVLTGSNLAWCHPVLYQRLAAAKSARPQMRIVVIDPRRTATCDIADMHLAVQPGADVALFNGLLAHLADNDAIDNEWTNSHVNGLDDAIAAARADDLTATGIAKDDLAEFYALWASTTKVVTVYSQGVNQSSSGTDKVAAILNCHLATARIGRPGMGPFSVTGQPNAMGGREVGGLANMLACHLDLENPVHRSAVRTFWDAPQAPETAGKKAVEMFRAVGNGEIKAIWIICTNPAVSMPDANAVRDAIAGCDFVVVSDVTDRTDTAKLADVLLPATGWGEKDGTVTNSERCISRQRAFLPAPGMARHDWDILADVGRRMGWTSAFDYTGPAEIFREYAALSGIAAELGRDFDISALNEISDAEFDDLAPAQWPISATRQGGRFFAQGQFYTADAKAMMHPVNNRAPASALRPDRPFRLNTGRVRDQWHTMTRTGKSARLSQHLAEPFLEIHPDDAAALALRPADLLQVTTDEGGAILRALVTDRVQPGQVFAPMHWTGDTAPSGRIDALVAPHTDPYSGQPESKASVCAVQRYDAQWYGFAVSFARPNPDTPYWAMAKTTGGWRLELSGMTIPTDWESYARDMLNAPASTALSVTDPARGIARIALTQGDQLVGALFTAPDPVALSRDHLAALLTEPGSAPEALAGRPSADRPDPGATICACFNVGVNTITSAIETQGLISVEAIGAALSAGTNCGSCRPELATLLAARAVPKAAE